MSANYCLITCIDYRIQEAFYDWIKEHHLLGKSDVIEIAGCSRDLALPVHPQDKEEILRNLDMSIKLHHPKNIFLFDHQDCGAYAQDNVIPKNKPLEADKIEHAKYLSLAKAQLNKIYPDLKVHTFYITLDHKVMPL